MGKSSLTIRIAERLHAEETAVAQLDLSTLGHTLNPEQWNYGLLFALGEQLDLLGELVEFWESHRKPGSAPEVDAGGPRRHPGAVSRPRGPRHRRDRLRAAAAVLHRRVLRGHPCVLQPCRADNPPMRRLSFCLLGTVTPSELIEDPNTTAFNIGRRIELNDFTEAEAATLARVWAAVRRPPRG